MRTLDTLLQFLTALPRVKLGHFPTPLVRLERLSHHLGVELFMKRDDCSGLAMGGNKGRKLDFIMADVLKKKADVVVTWAGVQSNWCRSVAAASRKLGLKPSLVLSKRPARPPRANRAGARRRSSDSSAARCAACST